MYIPLRLATDDSEIAVLQTADIDQVGLAFQALQDSIDKRRNEAMLGSYGL